MYATDVVTGVRPGCARADAVMLMVMKKDWNVSANLVCRVCEGPARVEKVEPFRRGCEYCGEMSFNPDAHFRRA